MRLNFKINKDAVIKVNLVDNLLTPIPPDSFSEIIENYSKSGSFYINFKYDVKPNDSDKIQAITSEASLLVAKYIIQNVKIYFPLFSLQTLENYLIEMNADHIILDVREGRPLNESNRLKVVKHVVNFLMTNFGKYPSTHVKRMAAKAVVTLFPCQRYKDSNGDGIVCLYF